MKDNLDSSIIGNRKIVIELRFEPIVSILDKKGLIAEKLEKLKLFATNHWEIRQGDVTIMDSNERETSTNFIMVSFTRISYISSNISSISDYYSKFEKIYNCLTEIISKPVITRIGCRILGSYKVKSTDYDDILKHFLESFPKKYILEPYIANDLAFNLVYENGMYKIGPVKTDDPFYANEFPGDKTNHHIGICIDTDNYVTNVVRDINDKSLIKDIFQLSLSVEKNLYTNLCDF